MSVIECPTCATLLGKLERAKAELKRLRAKERGRKRSEARAFFEPSPDSQAQYQIDDYGEQED